MIAVKSLIFRFGNVEVREREFSIIKASEVFPVEPKAFGVLLFQLHNPQKLITREELLDAVWGEAAVSRSNLWSRVNYRQSGHNLDLVHSLVTEELPTTHSEPA